MGIWSQQVIPRVLEVALGTDDIGRWRQRCLEGAHGVVVEPGFGSGLNLAHYPDGVTQVYAVEPSEVGTSLGAERIAGSAIDVERVGLDGESLPLGDDSCDAGVLTFTLCTIPDHVAALAELRRVIKPGGTLHFLEHGLAETERVQKWQHRLTPLQKRLVDGCHLNRAIVADIEAAGFEILWSEASFARGPKPAAWFAIGHACNPN